MQNHTQLQVDRQSLERLSYEIAAVKDHLRRLETEQTVVIARIERMENPALFTEPSLRSR